MSEVFIPDINLESPELMYPGRQPVGNVKIDRTKIQSNGIVGYWLMRGEITDLAEAHVGTDIGAVEHGYAIGGSYSRVNAAIAAAGDEVDLGIIAVDDPLRCIQNNAMSVMFISEFKAAAGNGIHQGNIPRLLDIAKGTEGYVIFMDLNTNAINIYISGVTSSFSAPIIGDGKLHTIVLTYKPGSTKYYVDGKLMGSLSNNSNNITGTIGLKGSIFNIAEGSGQAYGDKVNLLAVWDRELSSMDAAEVSMDPYCILVRN